MMRKGQVNFSNANRARARRRARARMAQLGLMDFRAPGIVQNQNACPLW
jgi:hypothetical protein